MGEILCALPWSVQDLRCQQVHIDDAAATAQLLVARCGSGAHTRKTFVDRRARASADVEYHLRKLSKMVETVRRHLGKYQAYDQAIQKLPKPVSAEVIRKSKIEEANLTAKYKSELAACRRQRESSISSMSQDDEQPPRNGPPQDEGQPPRRKHRRHRSSRRKTKTGRRRHRHRRSPSRSPSPTIVKKKSKRRQTDDYIISSSDSESSSDEYSG